jgi:hypothetical protein
MLRNYSAMGLNIETNTDCRGITMSNYQTTYAEQLIQEIKATPAEYLPALLQIVRLFRQSITLKPADSSFRQGWQEAMAGETIQIDDLWIGIDAE